MPKMVGNWIEGAKRIDRNMNASGTKRVRISYSQAVLLPPSRVMASLDTTDRGNRGTLAKRWYRWFATAAAIEACPRSTPRMLAAAGLARTESVGNLGRNLQRAAVAYYGEHEVRNATIVNLSHSIVNAAHCALVTTLPAGLLTQLTSSTDDPRWHLTDVLVVTLDAAEQLGCKRSRARLALELLWERARAGLLLAA